MPAFKGKKASRPRYYWGLSYEIYSDKRRKDDIVQAWHEAWVRLAQHVHSGRIKAHAASRQIPAGGECVQSAPSLWPDPLAVMSLSAFIESCAQASRRPVRRTESARVATMKACRLNPARWASCSSCVFSAAGNFKLVGLLAVLKVAISCSKAAGSQK